MYYHSMYQACMHADTSMSTNCISTIFAADMLVVKGHIIEQLVFETLWIVILELLSRYLLLNLTRNVI